MDSKTEIKKVVLQLGEKEITLTVEQCKKLKDLLSDMFGREIVKEIHQDNSWHWYRPYYYTSTTSLANPNITFMNATLTCQI